MRDQILNLGGPSYRSALYRSATLAEDVTGVQAMTEEIVNKYVLTTTNIQTDTIEQLKTHFLKTLFPILQKIPGFQAQDHNENKIRMFRIWIRRYRRFSDVPKYLLDQMSPLVQTLVAIHEVSEPTFYPDARKPDQYYQMLEAVEAGEDDDGEEYVYSLKKNLKNYMDCLKNDHPEVFPGDENFTLDFWTQFAQLRVYAHSEELTLAGSGGKGSGPVNIENYILSKRVGREMHIDEGLNILFKIIKEKFSTDAATICALATFAEVIVKWIHPFMDGNGRSGRALGIKIATVRPGITRKESVKSMDEILEEYEDKWEQNGIDEKSANEMFSSIQTDKSSWYYTHCFTICDPFHVTHWDKQEVYDITNARREGKERLIKILGSSLFS